MSTREEMLNAALDLFAAEGYDGVGIQRIVDACGVQKPTLYHYFGSKQGILEEIARSEFAPFLDNLETACRFNGDLTVTLESAVKAHFAFYLEKPTLYRLYLSLMVAPKDSDGFKIFTPFVERHYSILETMFRAAETQHGNMRGRSQRYAITFAGHIHAYITAYHYGHIALSEESAYMACKHYMHGILS